MTPPSEASTKIVNVMTAKIITTISTPIQHCYVPTLTSIIKHKVTGKKATVNGDNHTVTLLRVRLPLSDFLSVHFFLILILRGRPKLPTNY